MTPVNFKFVPAARSQLGCLTSAGSAAMPGAARKNPQTAITAATRTAVLWESMDDIGYSLSRQFFVSASSGQRGAPVHHAFKAPVIVLTASPWSAARLRSSWGSLVRSYSSTLSLGWL